MERFLELLARLDEDIAALTVDELTEARSEIAAYGRELRESAADVEDQDALLADVTALAGALTAIDAELETRATAAAEAEAARADAFSAFGEDEATEELAVDEEPVEEAADEPVVASPALQDIARRRPRVPAPEAVDDAPEVVVAAAVGDDRMGTRFENSDDLARAMFDANRRGPDGSRTVARMALEHPFELGAIPEDNWSVLQEVQRGVQQARLAGQSLTAAGFCAPAEPVYEYFQQGSRDGIIDLPTVTARRGRLTYPEIFNIRDLQVENGVGWETTSTMDADEVEKPCYTVACGDGVTFDVNGYSTCLKFSNFDSQFWPERVTHVNGQAMIAHDHEVNLALIAAIVADGRTTTIIDGHTNGGTWVQLSQSLALHAGFIRSRFRLPLSTVLEAGIPSFVRDALVADHMARDATVQYGMAVAEIEAAILRMGINVQWLYDWQELGHANWPADYDYLMWPAGTLVQLSGGSLDLGVTRDSTLNVANDFQVFTETFDGHAIVGSGVYYVTGVNLCPTGATGARETIACAAGS